ENRRIVVLALILTLGKPGGTACDSMVVKQDRGSSQRQTGSHGRPDPCCSWTKTERPEDRQRIEQSFVHARIGEDHQYQSQQPRVAKTGLTGDSGVGSQYEGSANPCQCASPIAVHPVTEQAQRKRQKSPEQRPRGRLPPLKRPTKRRHQDTAAQPDAEPWM